MERTEDQVAGEAGTDGHLGRFIVAYFADEHDVRVVAQHGAQAHGKVKTDPLMHLHLRDAGHLIFDGVFDGDNFAVDLVELAEGGIKRCGLSAAGGACDEDDSVWPRDKGVELRKVLRKKAK